MMSLDDSRDRGCAMTGHDAVARPLRIALQRWGLTPDEARAVLADCPSEDGSISWRLGEAAGETADVVIHLVDAQRLTGERGGATWNAMGPVHALRRSRQRGSTELAVVVGNAATLPALRCGCWILAGQRGFARTLSLVVAVLTNSQQPWGSRLEGLQLLAAFDATVTGFALHTRNVHEMAHAGVALQTLVAAAVVEPVAIWLRATEDVLPAILPRLQPASADATVHHVVAPAGENLVRGLIALPWPDLLQQPA